MPSGDEAVDEAATGITGALALFAEVYGRASYDGEGAPVSLTVHYGQDYDNAFWDGTQLVFGDGDGQVFGRFTRPVDVLGHELTHAVTEHTAGLVYRDQPGALNESVSDVFASCLKQRLLGQTPAEADWLIGAGHLRPRHPGAGPARHGRARHGVRRPGARQDPQVGAPRRLRLDLGRQRRRAPQLRHPQPRLPAGRRRDRRHDLGGRRPDLVRRAHRRRGRPESDFAAFAAATVAAAGAHADAVGTAWETVGVTPGASVATTPSAPVGRSRRVSVRRTGGFAGLRTDGELDLDGDDPRAPEVASLVDRVDLRAVTAAPTHPDRYVYDFDLCGDCATVPEQSLTSDLRRLADLVLG